MTHRTDEAFLMPFSSHGIHRNFGNGLHAGLTLRLMHPYMTSLAIRMAFPDSESIGLLVFIPRAFGAGCGRVRGIQERVSAFRAEKVEFVVVPLSQNLVVQSDEA